MGSHLEALREKLGIPAECYPLGNVDHFRLLKSRQLFEQMEAVNSDVFKWHGDENTTAD